MNDEWKLPWEGGCRCGQTRVRITAPPLLAGACHCTGCQRMTASAFSLSIAVPSQGFEVILGEPVIGGLHGPTRHFFCARCLSWMFTRPEGMDAFVNVRASVLDDRAWFVPYVEFWTSEKLPWASTPAKRSYAREPEYTEFETLLRGYAQEGARPR
jgi:hypothetical protein